MFLAGHTVAMVTYCVLKMITCSPMTGQFFDTMIVASIDRVAIMTRVSCQLTTYHLDVHIKDVPMVMVLLPHFMGIGISSRTHRASGVGM